MLPVELAATSRHASPTSIELACSAATRRRGSAPAVAVAVDAANVQQAAQLLFGTGVGVVGVVDPLADAGEPTLLSRQVLAAGANEVQLARNLLDPDLTAAIRSAVGDDVALTVNVPLLAGSLDLSGIERALCSGADFVKLNWPSADAGAAQIGQLFALFSDLGHGGAKLAIPDRHLRRVRLITDETFGAVGRSGHARSDRVRNYQPADRAWDL